jgi:hypothetical protein
MWRPEGEDMKQSAPVVPIGPPRYSEAKEQAVLGAILQDPAALAQAQGAGLLVAHWFDPSHGHIYGAMLELRQSGDGIDVVSVFEQLRNRGQAGDVGLEYLGKLSQCVPNARAVGVHAAALVELARLRAIDAVARAISATVQGSLVGDDLAARLANLQRDLERLTNPQKPAARIPVEWARDLAAELHAPRQIVEGVLLQGGMSMIFGESNSGKSYLAIHLAICVSLGLPWMGRRTEQGAVLYVAAEGAWSIRTRLAAYRKHHEREIGTFGLIPCALSLVDPSGDVEDLVALVREKTAELGEPITLIVIDTVARVMGGGDENAAQDMGRLVSAGDYIRQQTGAHLLYIHHAGKDASRGARGHSSLRAALDTEIEVTADSSTKVHTAKITKQRDLASNGQQLAGRFVPVELGTDQWGNAITACAVVDAEATPGQGTQRRLSGTQQAVLAYLAGREAGTRRTAVVDALISQGIARPSVYRAINDLVAMGQATITAGLLYVIQG